jgi:hypothetical protein
MLLEQATGFSTGSVYNDPSLKKIFKSEGRQNNVIAIKAHPNVGGWSGARVLKSFKARPPLMLVVRDPFRCIWSEGQRRMSRSKKRKTKGVTGNVHSMQVTREQLLNPPNWSKWLALAAKLADDYTAMWASYEMIIASGSDHIFVTFEKLTDPAQQGDTLKTMIDFIGTGFSDEKRRCAFVASNHDQIKRKKPEETAEQVATATFDDAFPQELACQIWAALLPGKVIAARLGYDWQYIPPFEC